MKIIWLTGWYPSKINYLEGDFVQRHAKAVSLIHQVEVIHIKKDDKKIVTNKLSEEITEHNNLTERIIYYHSPTTGINFIDKFLSHRIYKKLYKKAIHNYVSEKNLPDIVHVYIAMKAGLMGRWMKKKYNVPLLISEQWTAYLPEARPNLEEYDLIYQNWVKKIFSKADAVTVVSTVLGDAIKRRFNIKKYSVIPNVVDTDIFYPVERPSTSITKFIHVSLLNYQKNPNDIIEACQMVKKQGYNFELTIYGPEKKELRQQVKNNQLENSIFFKEEVPQNILAKDMQHADALILYSRYETFGCVVIEANACGIPVILSDLPVFREYIIENKTGIFAKPNDPGSLSKTIIDFIEQKNSFSQAEIGNYTKTKFGYEVIAKQFDNVYKALLNKPSMLNA